MFIRAVGYSMHVLQINVGPRQRMALCIVLWAGNQAWGCDCVSLSIFAFAFISVYNEHCTIDYRNPSQKKNSWANLILIASDFWAKALPPSSSLAAICYRIVVLHPSYPSLSVLINVKMRAVSILLIWSSYTNAFTCCSNGKECHAKSGPLE